MSKRLFTTYWIAFLSVWSAPGCRGNDAENEERNVSSSGEASSGIIVVGDLAVTEEDIRQRMKRDGATDAREIANELVDDLLLANDAAHKGVTLVDEELRPAKRLLAQRVLRDIEDRTAPEVIAKEEVQRIFGEFRKQFELPERRQVVHLLAQDSSDEARRYVDKALSKSRGSKDPEAALKANAQDEEPNFKILFEELPQMSEQSPFDQALKDAVFAAKKLGALSEPVKTRFGWHAVVVTKIDEAQEADFVKAEPEIRQQLSLDYRKKETNELVAHLKTTVPIERNDQAIEMVLKPAHPE